MKPTEAAALLTVAAAFDNRKPDADQAKAWAMALDGLRFEDCRDAVVAHFRASSEWLMPQKVIDEVKRIRAKRVAEYGPIEPPRGMDPDDTAALIEWQRNSTREIADGRPVERPPVVVGIPVPEAIRELRRKAEHDERDGLDDTA